MRGVTRILALSAAAGLAVAVAGCGSDKPDPQHSYSRLTGDTTTLTLDPTFVAGLNALGVRPAPLGKAKVAMPKLTFPITGGNLDIYKPGDATPAVQGEIDHKGSGLRLTVGKGKKQKNIELKHIVIDPGKSLGGVVYANGGRIGGTVDEPAELFDLDASKMPAPTVDSDGVATLTGIKVKLSKDAAGALNLALNLTGAKQVHGGLLVGTATIVAAGKS
jgi:hypothetical protein